MDPKEVFDAQAVSIEAVLREPNRGLYIPSYQRQYAWRKEQARALISSICDGINALSEMDDAITFIGTFIFVHDKAYATVEPQVRHDLPAAVFLVIDGQQRLSTVSMMAVAIHDIVTSHMHKTKSDSEDVTDWLNAQQLGFKKRLERMFAIDKDVGYGDETLRYYPRLIRAHVDSWSNRKGKSRYESPVARLLRQYIEHWQMFERSDDYPDFKFVPGEDELSLQYAENYRAIRQTLTALFQARGRRSDDDDNLPELSNVARYDAAVLDRYFSGEVPTDVRTIWSKDTLNSNERRICELSRAFLFSGYFLNRVAVTQVLVKKEDYAFDLFEALNTTGEPLTAFETFKPLVIKAESLEGYQDSPSAQFVERVELFLTSHGERRREASDRLLVPFALYSNGKKLGRGLRDQRNWLRFRFETSIAGGKGSLADKRDFLSGMAIVADFLRMCWPEGARDLQLNSLGSLLAPQDMNRLRFCLMVLKDAKHDVTVAVLARFFEAVLDGPDTAKVIAAKEFVEAVCAVTAFYALWRGSRVGTDNIDAIYRRTMQGLVELNPTTGETFPPFHRSARPKVAPSSTSLKEILRRQLQPSGLNVKDTWVERALQIDVYRQAVPLTKLLLLAAMNDVVPSATSGATPVRGKRGCSPMLTTEHWSANLQVEHVAPRKGAMAKWDQEIYVKQRVDCIGNLLLLPGAENSSVSNYGWAVKRLYYRILSTETQDESDALIAEAKVNGVDLSAARETRLSSSSEYLPYLRSVAALPADHTWDVPFIDVRSRQLLGLAWDSLAPWIGLS